MTNTTQPCLVTQVVGWSISGFSAGSTGAFMTALIPNKFGTLVLSSPNTIDFIIFLIGSGVIMAPMAVAMSIVFTPFEPE
jgi:hypothetical protein